MSNKAIGTEFEIWLADKLAKRRFWVHRFTQSERGQPADIIAVKGNSCWLIDAKHCAKNGFDLNRIESNQWTAMALWDELCRTDPQFALILPGGEVWMVPLSVMNEYGDTGWLTADDIRKHGTELEDWLEECTL